MSTFKKRLLSLTLAMVMIFGNTAPAAAAAPDYGDIFDMEAVPETPDAPLSNSQEDSQEEAVSNDAALFTAEALTEVPADHAELLKDPMKASVRADWFEPEKGNLNDRDGGLALAFDGKFQNAWHTAYGKTAESDMPHWIQWNLGEAGQVFEVSGLHYEMKNHNASNGFWKRVTIQALRDGTEVASKEFSGDAITVDCNLLFDAPVAGVNGMKVTVHEANGNYACAGELTVFENPDAQWPGPVYYNDCDVNFYAYVDGERKLVANRTTDLNVYWVNGSYAISAADVAKVYEAYGVTAAGIQAGSKKFGNTGRNDAAVWANRGAIAEVNGQKYLTLQEAVDAAEGKTTEGNGVKVPEGKDIVFDFAGHTYTVNTKTVGSTGTETNGFQLLKGAAVVMKNGTLNAGTSAKILVQKYCDLTLESVAAFKGNHIVDTSAHLGKLIVTSDIALDESNAQMAVYDGTGYLFGDMAMNQELRAQASNTLLIWMKPFFVDKATSGVLFRDGAEDNQIKMGVILTWTRNDGTVAKQTFEFSESMIAGVYPKGTLEVGIAGIEGLQNVQVRAMVISDTGINAYGDTLLK